MDDYGMSQVYICIVWFRFIYVQIGLVTVYYGVNNISGNPRTPPCYSPGVGCNMAACGWCKTPIFVRQDSRDVTAWGWAVTWGRVVGAKTPIFVRQDSHDVTA